MSMPSPKIRDLARQLLALEAAQGKPSDDQVNEAVKVCEKLRVIVSKLVGVAGFRSLLSRALALAKAEVPWLRVVRVQADSSLAGFDEVERDEDTGVGGNGECVLVAQLLGLLVTFIGQSLTLSLVRDAWPDATWGGMELGSGDMP